MLTKTLLTASIAVIIFSTGNAYSQRLLATRDIADRVDRDSLTVTGFKGDMRRIRFRVTLNPVRLYRCVIIYRNGGRDRCSINSLIRRGGYTRWIDLHGTERVIRRVDIWYDAKTPGWTRGRARIWLYGLD